MPPINVYTRREDFTSTPPRPKSFSLNQTASVLPLYDLFEYDMSGIPVYAFAYQINDPNANFALASMCIPAYFDQARTSGSVKQETQGIFLINMGEVAYIKPFFEDIKILGPFGCPKRVLTSNTGASGQPIEEYFTFNKMRFYPFIMTDFTVGYYVCDAGVVVGNAQPRNAWPPYSAIEHGVSLDHPLAYDPTLGLYMTRAAHIEP